MRAIGPSTTAQTWTPAAKVRLFPIHTPCSPIARDSSHAVGTWMHQIDRIDSVVGHSTVPDERITADSTAVLPNTR